MLGNICALKKLVGNRKHVGIYDIEAVGNYAIRIKFDDLHEAGIYSWEYLYSLGKNKYHNMRTYVKDLKENGLTRFDTKRFQKIKKK